MRRETREIGGLSVTCSGGAGAPLLMLVRMASRGACLWDPVWDRLGRHFSVVQFDLRMPSTAELDDPRRVFTALAAQCVEVAAGLGHDRFHLFGWTGGTHVALRCMADFPQRVASSLLLGPFWTLDDMRAAEKGFEFARTLVESGNLALYSYYWYMGGLSPGFVERNFDQVERWADQRNNGDAFLKRDPAQIIKWMRALRGCWIDLPELAGNVTPTLIIAHELDPWHAGPSAAMARALHTHLPHARFELLEGLGSMAPIEDPDRVYRAALPFYSALLDQPLPGFRDTGAN
jgi:pimeloyl-ACP methyl ester carboxylesterase